MELTHHFTVPVAVEEAWAHFQDIASVGGVLPRRPGHRRSRATTFSGSVKVKLGPIALVYNGTGQFTEQDDDAHRFVVEAKGKDKRGNGTAGATVTADHDGCGRRRRPTSRCTPTSPSPASRRSSAAGVMQDVSDKLLGQFVSCLEQRMGEGDGTGCPRRRTGACGGGRAAAAAAEEPLPGQPADAAAVRPRRAAPAEPLARHPPRHAAAPGGGRRRLPARAARTTRSTSARPCCRSW